MVQHNTLALWPLSTWYHIALLGDKESETRHNCPTDTPSSTPIGNPPTITIYFTSITLPLHHNRMKCHDKTDGASEGSNDG